MDKRNGRKAAFTVLKSNKIITVSLDNIVYLIKEQGYDILDFSMDNNAEIKELSSSMKVEQLLFKQNAFTYKKGDTKAVFVNETLSIDEKKYVLAHELGHIICGHMERSYCSGAEVMDEYEANAFAHNLLSPTLGSKLLLEINCHKRVFVTTIIVIAILCLIILGIFVKRKNDSYFGEYYVTEDGEKFHKKNCIYIKDRSNIHRITIDEYEEGKYEPCKVCLPEGEEE